MLNEINQKILKQNNAEVLYRFLQDIHAKVNIFIWQHQGENANAQFGIKKVQFSNRDHIIEWKENKNLKYGRVDEGENPMGIKRSPVMILREEVDPKAFQQILTYLETVKPESLKEIEFLKSLFYFYGLHGTS